MGTKDLVVTSETGLVRQIENDNVFVSVSRFLGDVRFTMTIVMDGILISRGVVISNRHHRRQRRVRRVARE